MAEFKIPEYVNFSYARDYVNLRNRFQKGYTSFSGEPGYFYFRIFFDWDSPLLAWSDDPSATLNVSARQFLLNNRYRCACDKRLQGLQKFRKLLYFIANETPWAFRKVTKTGGDIYTDLAQPGKGSKSLSIECSEEFTDFRITLLLDLYRFICFDQANQRVIVPENLRKFNMSVMYFGVPLRWLHTPIEARGLKASLNAGARLLNRFGTKINVADDSTGLGFGSLKTEGEFADNISVHMIHFTDCELTPKSTHSSFSQGETSKPSQYAATLELTYRRAFTQDISEWFELQISELDNSYSDSAPAVDLNAPAKPRSAAKQILTNLLNKIAPAYLKDFAGAETGAGLTPRRRYMRNASLYGGDWGEKLLNRMAESAIDKLTGAVAQKFSLGNIYDGTWLTAAPIALTRLAAGWAPRGIVAPLVRGSVSGLSDSLARNIGQGIGTIFSRGTLGGDWSALTGMFKGAQTGNARDMLDPPHNPAVSRTASGGIWSPDRTERHSGATIFG